MDSLAPDVWGALKPYVFAFWLSFRFLRPNAVTGRIRKKYLFLEYDYFPDFLHLSQRALRKSFPGGLQCGSIVRQMVIQSEISQREMKLVHLILCSICHTHAHRTTV